MNSTIFDQSIWNFFKITIRYVINFAGKAAWLDQNCGCCAVFNFWGCLLFWLRLYFLNINENSMIQRSFINPEYFSGLLNFESVAIDTIVRKYCSVHSKKYKCLVSSFLSLLNLNGPLLPMIKYCSHLPTYRKRAVIIRG